MNQTITHASLFSGFGAADLAATWMGWDNAFWCEIDSFPRTVLSYWFPKSIGYENIKETDFSIWRGKIDVLTGGFPCQPFSCAGKRRGAEDDRYLWPEMLRAIREIRPAWVIGENVAGMTSMVQPGSEVTVESQASLFKKADKETLLEQEYVIETVCNDLEHEGYSVQPVIIPACAVGAPHRRDRVWFIAYRTDTRAKDLQSGGKDGVCKPELAPDSCRKRCDNGSHCRAERPVHHNEERDTPKNQPKREERKRRACKDDQDVADTDGVGLQGGICPGCDGKVRRETSDGYAPEYAIDGGGTLHPASWEDFPTQPPVCRRDDGLPFDVVRLAVPFGKWREGAIKGYGNAMVPQVIYEIFKGIETIQNLKEHE